MQDCKMRCVFKLMEAVQFRGTSWMCGIWKVRVVSRYGGAALDRGERVGFRLVHEIEGEACPKTD